MVETQDRSYSERSKALICRNLFSEKSDLLKVGRFELLRTIGRGATGVVYEVLDPERRRRVALKTLHRNGPSELYRLKHEFRSLAELQHPNLVVLHELHVTPGEAYFTMDLVDGDDFVSALRRGAAHGELPKHEAALWSAFRQLCQGVRALHDAGKLHRDLKPANVLVTGAGDVVLLDFGLVHDAQDTHDGHQDGQNAKKTGAGTPGYMAPEQMAGFPGRASDWYSVGVMLAEALGLPASAEQVRGHSLSPLADLAARLVHPDPAARPGFDDIQAALHRATTAPAVRRAVPLPFAGRERELAALHEALEASRKGPVFAVVSGESGIGKSALLREFASRQLGPGGALVLRGRCYERESIPYKALDAVVDALSHHLHEMPCGPEDGALEGAPVLPSDELTLLLQTFPVLGRVRWQSSAPVPAPVGLSPPRVSAANPLKAIFRWLSVERPLVLMMDDLQWADDDSARLLASLLCDDDSPPVLAVATDRKVPDHGEGIVAAFARAAAQLPRPIAIRSMALSPLSTHEALALAVALLDPEGLGERAAEVAREAGGNPLFVTELARSLASSASGAPPAQGIDTLFDRRRASLRASSQAVLELLAVAGRPLSQQVLALAIGANEHPVEELEELARAHLVRTAPSAASPLFEVAHDRIALSVTERLDPSYKVSLHVRLAHAFERNEGPDSEALVEQYAGARMPLEAARSARRAASRALSVFAFARAAALSERALALGTWTVAEAGELHRDHALALEQIGRGEEAAREFEKAALSTADPIVASSYVSRAVQQLLHHGHRAAGDALLRRGYEALGLAWPGTRAELILAIALRSIPRRLRDWKRTLTPEQAALERARAEFLTGVGRGIENYDALRAVYNALLCFDSAERIDDPAWRARASGARGLMRCFGLAPGGAERGLAELRAAYAAAEHLGDDAMRADIGRQLSATLIVLGEPSAALDAAIASDASYRRLPVPSTDLNVGVGFKGTALVQLGRLREARLHWNAIVHEARSHRDLRTRTYVNGHPARFALLYAGEQRKDVDDELERLEALRAVHGDYQLLAFMGATNRLESALYWGTVDDVTRLVEREGRVLFGTGYGLLNDEARFLRARFHVRRAAAAPPGASRERWLRVAAADARARRPGSGPFVQARIHLVEAGIANVSGRTEDALARLDAAADALRKAGASRTVPVVDCCRGSVIGGDEGKRIRDEAGAALRAEGVVQPARWARWATCGFSIPDECLP